jgi:hypothetical protein
VSGFSSLLKLNNIPLYVNTICCLLIHLWMDIWVVMGTVSNAAISVVVQMSIEASVFIPWDIFPIVELLGMFNFLRILYIVFRSSTPFYCPNYGTQGLHFLYILMNAYFLFFFSF